MNINLTNIKYDWHDGMGISERMLASIGHSFKDIKELLLRYITLDFHIIDIDLNYYDQECISIFLSYSHYIDYTSIDIPYDYTERKNISIDLMNMYNKLKRDYNINKLLEI